MPELEPMNRTEALLAGEDLEPTNRLEYFLKQAGSGKDLYRIGLSINEND